MGECGICKQGIVINDDPLACVGKCGARFHRRCTALTKAAAKLITDNVNVLFKCDECLSGHTCDERDDLISDVTTVKEEMKTFISESISDIRKNITAQINSALECGIEMIKNVLNDSLQERVNSMLDGSVAKTLDEINCKLFELSNRDKNLAVMNRKRDITGRTIHSESDCNPIRKKRILENRDNEPMQVEIDVSEQDNEVFTYAKVLRGVTGNKTKARVTKNRKTRPVIVIKPVESSQTNDDTRKELKEKLDPKIHKVSNFRNGKDGSIIVECATDEDVNTVKSGIESNLGGKYSAVLPTAAKPKVKIVGMSDQYASETFIDLLKSQNEGIGINEVKVIAEFKNPRFRYNKYNVVLEVDNVTYKCLMSAKKVNIGWDRCPVVEALNILRCFKCGEFGHKSTECKNNETCSKCSGNHKTSDCSSTVVKCVNCVKMNNERKMNLDVNHPAFSTQCLVYQRLYQKKKSNMQFSE